MTLVTREIAVLKSIEQSKNGLEKVQGATTPAGNNVFFFIRVKSRLYDACVRTAILHDSET